MDIKAILLLVFYILLYKRITGHTWLTRSFLVRREGPAHCLTCGEGLTHPAVTMPVPEHL